MKKNVEWVYDRRQQYHTAEYSGFKLKVFWLAGDGFYACAKGIEFNISTERATATSAKAKRDIVAAVERWNR